MGIVSSAASKRGRLSPLLQQSSGITAVRAEGMYLEDQEGRRYLDFGSGIGVNSTGHCHPKVVAAVREQAGKLIHGQYTTVKYPSLLELTERLGSKMPGDIDSLFFASAGTEAVEAAVRLSRQATRRPNIVVFQGSFHGRTAGALAMTTSKVGLRAGLQPLMGGVVVAPFPNPHYYGWDEDTTTDFCLRELDNILDTYSAPLETAAFFIEPIQGDGGYVPATRRFLEGLRKRADEHGILLAFDEVQAGFGRSGKFWAHEHFGVEPDILITAKGLASGFPLSAFGASAALMKQGWLGSQGGTYGGNPVSCAAAIATLNVIESEGLVENAAERGAQMSERLMELGRKSSWIGDVRGKGLMMGTVIVDGDGKPDGDRAATLLRKTEERGLLMLRCGTHGHIIRWLPPLIVTPDQIDQAVAIFDECLGD
jgi:acetylornithine aminotransferase/4-aminobutyrate aminotransferase